MSPRMDQSDQDDRPATPTKYDETSPLLAYQKQPEVQEVEVGEVYTFVRVPRRRPLGKLEFCILGLGLFLIAIITIPHRSGLQPIDEQASYLHSLDVEDSHHSPKNDKYYVGKLPSHLLPTTYIHKSNSNRRLVLLGDVHGVKSSLDELLSKISFNPQLDHLILTGDMIDKGPSSHGVISRARELNASCVRGNHEDKVLAFYGVENEPLADGTAPKDIREQGIAKDLTPEDLDWIKHCPLILRLGPVPGKKHTEAVVVHAGLLPGIALEEQKPFDVMHMRSISQVKGKAKAKHGKHKKNSAKYRAFENMNKGDSPWWKVWNKVQERLPKRARTMVIYGHDRKTGLNHRDWSIGLDSGCVRGGKLTALIVEGEDEKTGEPRMSFESVQCKDYA